MTAGHGDTMRRLRPLSRPRRTASCSLLLWVLCPAAMPLAHAAPDPDACIEGYVWREAVPDDHVCVTPAVRADVIADNRMADTRRETRHGKRPDTCKPGFVWREATPDDRVCVTLDTREQTARDNRDAATRRLLPARVEKAPHPIPEQQTSTAQATANEGDQKN